MILPVFAAKVFNKLRVSSVLNCNYAISVNGKKMSIPVLGKLGYQNLLQTEPWMTQMLIRLKPMFRGHFVDVGVNVGQTLIKAEAVYDKVSYTGFEPNTSCVHYLEKLVNANGFRNVEIIPVGINHRSEVLKLNFYYSDGADPSASIIENFRPGEPVDHFRYVPVFDCSYLESFLPLAENPVLKIDVEGAELEVLKSMTEWIRKVQPLVLIEILPVYTDKNEFRMKRQQELEALLGMINYRIARIRKDKNVGIEAIESIGIHSNPDDCDYLLYPVSLADAVANCMN